MSEAVKFYTDEHVAKAVAKGLRRRGADVMTTYEADLIGASDEVHLSFATRQGRVLFTQDADFLRLHAAGADHAGIAYAPQHTSIGDIIRGLMQIEEALDAGRMKGSVQYL